MKVEILEAELHYLNGMVDLSGTGLALPLPRGFGLAAHPSDNTKLVPADGVDGYVLERDMLGNTTDAEKNANILAAAWPDNSFARPYVEGATVSARRATRMELEGADVLLTSGTGALSGSTPVKAKLAYKLGKLRVAQTGDEHVWTVRRQLAPEDSANTFRLEIAREANPVI